MKQHNHAVVWIDHDEAKVFHFNAEGMDKVVFHPEDPHVHIHHKANSIGSGHAAEDNDYLHAVVEAIGTSRYVLLTGPGLAKTALMKHIAAHDPGALDKIVGIETVDHPSDGALLKHARAYFHAEDLMTPQK
ncbi:translational machinery protein [Lichenifustis flavocetrariae]|uniref:Translational machinery protein n=1 Tax=Lichenifustis flavocetrariae TaxID=2949735 RepID=A0AA42CMU0_9HYPH|nr:translational machinery protein [Lichenifustis flavocetrariae]MCW6513054.1 translational machinery protein [Lichenifustis flavocetrariae]